MRLVQLFRRAPVQTAKPCATGARPATAATPPRSMAAPQQSLSVAVIGAGAAGLAAARELSLEGHSVTVFEQSAQLGGVWHYTDAVDEDPLGQAPSGSRVHGSMYAGLRTNLPREVMGFAAFPFDYAFQGSRDPDQFCSHREVRAYLEAFARSFDLLRFVRFGTAVRRVVPLPPTTGATARPESGASGNWWRWQMVTGPAGGESTALTTEDFDAVVVCNGHFSTPRVPDFPGRAAFPGLQLHSHNYRHPEPFRGQTLVLVGAAFSGIDIAQELLGAGARRVYLSARAWEDPTTGDAPDEGTLSGRGSTSGDLVKAANVAVLGADGSVAFEDGSVATNVDTVMYCTGYLYRFPFLEDTPAAPAVDDNRVHPAYRHVFPPSFAPTLSFVGLPWKVVPFPQFELQARWVARCLSARARLPGEDAMLADVEAAYAGMRAQGLPVRYTHRQQGELQRRYNEWLTQASGPDVPAWPEWRSVLHAACGASRKANGLHFRDFPMVGTDEALAAARAEAEAVRAARVAPTE